MTISNNDDGSPGFGVYVHWPFCAAKCPYCDFNSHVRHDGVNQHTYAQAFEREIRYMAERRGGETVTSIFFGGGTPSLMEAATVERILSAIHEAWPVQEGIEITLEANPTSVEAQAFRDYRAAGVNRVSLGVQSLDDDQLRFLGRLHTAAEACGAIALAREIFPRMSFDLIYARPDQTEQQWRDELTAAIDLAADHLSLYQLTIEHGTPFFEMHKKGRLSVPSADAAADLYEVTQEVTTRRGLPAYEISNHARPGCESRHNLTYWRSGEWVGLGPGAHGRLHSPVGRQALSNERNPERWLARVSAEGHALIEDETLTREEQADEMLLMGLRLREGFDLGRYAKMFALELDPERLADLEQHGMVERIHGGRIRATPSGFLVLDAVIADLAA